ncbi:MAG TPA: phosphatidylserine/phosphatidylglycerophosphate/cardiolipin synthase family protein [Patescibacteria group bacterium]|nr:phosphatidylserine/phosphatidylglycerophosphate/cardiolipin synthase family protein [Patescibacteria group bacterium]
MHEIDNSFENNRNSNLSLVSPLEFFSYLHQNIPQAKTRAWVQTMNFEADHFTGLIQHMLTNAANRGIDTRFTADYFYKMVTDGNIDYIPAASSTERSYRSFRRSLKYDLVSRLQDAGVEVNITNPPKNIGQRIVPAKGRNHIKMAIIDDVAFVGGINLSDKDFSRKDFMIKVIQPEFVLALAQVYQEGRPEDDYSIVMGNTSLLVDSGRPNKSLILDSALNLISTAKSSVIVTSQFTPDGKLPQRIDQASKKGIQAEVIVSAPNKISEPPAWLFDRINALTLRMRRHDFSILECNDWLHVKVILIDEGTTSAKVLVGTHNFSEKGVKWGNQEVSLLSTDSVLIDNISKYIDGLKEAAILRT